MPDTSPKTARIEAFSDGVIAIVITIMILELKLPEHAGEGDFWHSLLAPLLPKLIPYILSFIVIAIMWVNHHHLLDSARRAGYGVMWCNNNLLFWMTLIPVSTAFLGEHPFNAIAVATYGFVLAACTWAFTLLRWNVTRDEHGHLSARYAAILKKSLVGTSLYTASVPLAFVSIYISMAIFVTIPAIFFLPSFLLPRWATDDQEKHRG